jgi:hypothetical protein
VILLPIFILAQFSTSLNVNLDIPLAIGGSKTQPASAVEHTENCDDVKYNCARRLLNDATQEEIEAAIKKYGPDVKVFAHGDKIWYIIGPQIRGIPQ